MFLKFKFEVQASKASLRANPRKSAGLEEAPCCKETGYNMYFITNRTSNQARKCRKRHTQEVTLGNPIHKLKSHKSSLSISLDGRSKNMAHGYKSMYAGFFPGCVQRFPFATATEDKAASQSG